MMTIDSMDDWTAVNFTIRVLLVDDQPMVGEAIRRALLQEPNAEFHYCADARLALEVAKAFRPTVILQDLIMPNVSGLDLVRQYRADPVTAAIPIIVLSSREEPLVKSEAFKLGANDYLVKLPDPIEMVARVHYHSMAYLARIQRDEAYSALRESQRRLVVAGIALAENESRYRLLADNAPDIITESRLDGVLTYVSSASFAITGFTPEELMGRTFLTVMEPEDGQKVLEMCQAVFASKGKIPPWPVEFRTRHKSGAEIWLECKPTLAVDPVTGRFKGLNDIIRDITPRKALEAQLRRAQAEAETAAAVKAEFLANMSHELRTPLTSIIGFTGLAAEQADLTDLTRTYVERVANASRALLCTVNDVLDFSKLEAGQVSIQPQPVSLAKLSRATLDLFSPQAGAKDLDLVLDGDPADENLVVNVDPDRIRQILLNLVGNAVKFTASGSVTLRTRYDRPAQTLRVDVVDTGAGVSQDKQDRLFKRFSQVDGSLTRAQGGTGLGLAICKGLVEAMGGEIGLESGAGEGSRFWFEIPAPMASLAKADDALSTKRPLDLVGLRVLVVDDHPANRELARLFLAGVGVEISEAADGEEAVQRAAEWPYDLILMDVRMPKLDGPGALRRIRALGGPNDATPILAFTADADEDTVERLVAMGFQGVVAKPIGPAALINAVARVTALGQDRISALAHAS